MIQNFQVNGFRAFRHLGLSDLKSINLIVGKNSTGKTTVLEALRLYLSDDNWLRVAEILSARDEFDLRGRRKRTEIGMVDVPPLAFESLFYGRPKLDTRPTFSMSAGGPKNLDVRFSWLKRVEDDVDASVRYIQASDEEDAELDQDVVPGFEFTTDARSLMPLDRLDRWARRRPVRTTESNVVYLAAPGMRSEEIGRGWDAVALTEDEDVVIESLRSIVPTLEKLVMIQGPTRSNDRLMMAKLSQFSEPVPFKSLGDGAIRMLSITLAMIKARGGSLLADEVENGIHYSVQPQLWSLISEFSKRWSVQVFATTHSWDCVVGLQEAIQSSGGVDAAVHRLERSGGSVRAVPFDMDEIRIASEEQIEVR